MVISCFLVCATIAQSATMTGMNDQMYDDFALEKKVKAEFGQNLDIDAVIAREFPISRSGTATLFLTNKKQLYLYIHSKSQLSLGDVQKIVTRAGLKADVYIPPKDRAHYFDEVGTEKFRAVFPGRTSASPSDIAYYRTLTPYNPALVLVSEVRDGHVYQFDSDNTSGWRIAVKFTYRRIKTS